MTEQGSRLLDTVDPLAALRWDSLLELQVATYLPYELHFFFNWDQWGPAQDVLDAGCGNGYFLSHLKRYFPSKTYVGVDQSAQLVAAAQQNPHLANVRLTQSDFFAYQPDSRFDVVIMRLIVQHMSGFDAIFGQLNKLIKPDGHLVIIEPEPRLFYNHPATPVFHRLMVEYAHVTAGKKLNRAVLSSLDTGVASISGWRVRSDRTLVAPFVGPFRNTRLLSIFYLWIDIFEQSQALPFPFDDARAELAAWAQRDDSFSQVGVRIVEVARSA